MKASIANILLFNIKCPHCEHGHLIAPNDSYDFEPSFLSEDAAYYCGDCAKSSKVSKALINQVCK